MSDILFVISLFIFLIAPFFAFGLTWWGWCMVTIAIVVIVYEAISAWMSKDRLTISRRFWRWSVEKDENGKFKNRWKAWLVLGSLQAGWMSLLLHLAWKMLTVK